MPIKIVDEHKWEAQYRSATVASLLRYGPETFSHTLEFYEVRNYEGEIILTSGVALWSVVRPPELWLALAKPYFVNLRQSLALTAEALQTPTSRWPGLVCDVLRTAKAELHFVKHFGWTPTGRASLRPNAENYIQFGVV